jgi:DNA polymerase-3 subunit beta
MKVICSQNELLEAVNTVTKAIASKSPMPILEGILIKCDEDQMILTGFDSEIGIEYYIKADIAREGMIVIDSRIFGELLRKLPNSDVIIDVDQNLKITIDCLNTHIELTGIEASTYPALPDVEKEKPFIIKQSNLRDMIKRTIFSVGVDDNRKTLTGSLIESKNSQLSVVAIDGFRVSIRKSTNENQTDDFSVIVPGKTLNEIVKIIMEDDDDVTIYSNQSMILFELKNCKIISRLIEGNYLNYENILPVDYETNLVLNRRELLESLERVSLLANDENKYPLRFKIVDDRIILNSMSERGNAKDEIEVEVDGKNQEIGFNSKYLVDALKAIDEDEVYAHFTSSVGPCTLKPKEGDEFLYMVLPVRTHAEED